MTIGIVTNRVATWAKRDTIPKIVFRPIVTAKWWLEVDASGNFSSISVCTGFELLHVKSLDGGNSPATCHGGDCQTVFIAYRQALPFHARKSETLERFRGAAIGTSLSSPSARLSSQNTIVRRRIVNLLARPRR